MRLYIETMDAILVEFDPSGAIRLENEEWRQPSLQERRAIIYAATKEIEELSEVLEKLQN